LTQAQPVAWCCTIFPGEEHFCQPAEAGAPANDIFAPFRWTLTEPAVLYYLQGCRVLGDEGAVISPDNQVFAEFTFPPNDSWLGHSCFRRRSIPRPVDMPGWYATLAYPASKFFFHWMVESLPRMALLTAYAELLDGIFVPSPLQPFHIDSLAALGIPHSKLIPLDSRAHYRPQHLFVPRAFAMYNPPSWVHAWYKEHFIQQSSSTVGAGPRRIYVSRSDAPGRRLRNEPELLRLLGTHGFEAVRLSELPFLEQAALFNSADAIIAPHGAGLSNLVFCRPETAVLELFSSRWTPPCFMQLAATAGCRYSHIVGPPSTPGTITDGQKDDFDIPADQVEKLLMQLLAL
jgi:capsular polysaccharide biosynthesis protein